MGTYIYKIKPSNSITVEGLGETLTVHCAEYAYKPFGAFSAQWDYGKNRYVEGDEINRRMHFRSGAQGCDNAWKRRDDRPEYVTLEDAESIKRCYTEWHRYGSGAPVYWYTGSPGHCSDGRLDEMFCLGWIYWSEHDQQFILQYRQLDALEDDPRRAA
jgi:hypothetical protein